eukprot:UN18509
MTTHWTKIFQQNNSPLPQVPLPILVIVRHWLNLSVSFSKRGEEIWWVVQIFFSRPFKVVHYLLMGSGALAVGRRRPDVRQTLVKFLIGGALVGQFAPRARLLRKRTVWDRLVRLIL